MLRILFATVLACLVISPAAARTHERGSHYHVVTKFCGDRVCGVEAATPTKRYAVKRAKVVRVVKVEAPALRVCTGVKSLGANILAAIAKGVAVPVDLVDRTIRFFVGKGYSFVAATGIAGNIKAESNFNVNDVGDGGRARGLAQWHPDRFHGLRKLAAATGRAVTDFHLQLEYIDVELRARERLAFERLQTARTVREATAAFVHFERPQWYTPQRPERAHSFAQRLKWANRYAEQYAHHGEPAQLVSAGI